LAGEQRSIGLVLGGEADSRLTWCLHMGTSPDTLLRLIRRQPLAVHVTPRVLGIDDWAMCKGQRYGTILVDLERGEAIELLEDRTAEVVATWLEQHPGVEIVSRDRANAYADGARQGAPEAIQVADRFHLVKNMVDAVERAVTRLRPRITQAVQAETSAVPERAVTTEMNAGDDPAPSQSPLSSPSKPAPKMTRTEQIQQERRAKRLARYNEAVSLHEQDVGIREIARRLQASPGRIRIWLHAGHFPERAKRKRRPHRLDPFEPYLRQRWQDGCTNATHLFRELQQQGYHGSYSAISQHIAPWRTPEQFWVKGRRRRKLVHRSTVLSRPASALPAPRRMAFMFIRQPEALDDEDLHMLAAWLTDSDVRSVYDLAQDFTRMIRERQREHLDTWLANADVCSSVELRNFAMVLQRDYAAVANALDSIWSNGQVEGQVNRLKTVKRQMYGRGKLDLLKQRYLNTT
jgi:transposase